METKSHSRRTFLAGALLGGVLSVGAVTWKFLRGRKSDDPYIARVEYLVKADLSFLDIDKDGLRQFALDHKEKIGQRRSRESIVQNFLFSSDLLMNTEENNRTIHYVKFYDPYDTVCSNPFAKL